MGTPINHIAAMTIKTVASTVVESVEDWDLSIIVTGPVKKDNLAGLFAQLQIVTQSTPVQPLRDEG